MAPYQHLLKHAWLVRRKTLKYDAPLRLQLKL